MKPASIASGIEVSREAYLNFLRFSECYAGWALNDVFSTCLIVPAGAIETLFDDQNKPWFKRADLGRYLGIAKVKNSMNIPSHFMCKRQDIEGPVKPAPDWA